MPAPAQVVVVGSYNHDHVWQVDRFCRPGETRRARGFVAGPGGKGFNQAVACVRQDVATSFIGAIGDDHLGAAARRLADAEGLRCRWQVRDDAPTGAAGILVDDGGQNQIVVALGANERLDPAFVRAQREAFAAAHVMLVQLENNLDAIDAALELAGAAGAVRMLNPAPAHAELSPGTLRRCDLITPNETEFALLCARFAGIDADADALAALADADLHALARRLPVPCVVITLGRHGCFVSHADDGDRRGDAATHYRLPCEPAHTIDATGAGDAFSGALAAAMVRYAGRPFVEAVRHANRAAALSTERVGAAPAMPRWAEVLARFPG
ncbi:MAG: ribokinase [Mizugakiibacter sp.]|uniref:ribokinase n=1 Tax=Mizugakiibacter sp. TaxID=1972610 RepID=UPI0031C2F0EA|nr:ribokinase [Xanthomonadaceae bacterium]